MSGPLPLFQRFDRVSSAIRLTNRQLTSYHTETLYSSTNKPAYAWRRMVATNGVRLNLVNIVCSEKFTKFRSQPFFLRLGFREKRGSGRPSQQAGLRLEGIVLERALSPGFPRKPGSFPASRTSPPTY